MAPVSSARGRENDALYGTEISVDFAFPTPVFSGANLQVLANTGSFWRFWVFLPEKKKMTQERLKPVIGA